MENIFENAKFGDVFVTRDGRQATFVGLFIDDEQKIWRKIVIANESEIRYYNNSGKSGLLGKYDGDFPNDLVSRYQKPIDEMKLELDTILYMREYCKATEADETLFEYEDMKTAYKRGYRKAKEE